MPRFISRKILNGNQYFWLLLGKKMGKWGHIFLYGDILARTVAALLGRTRVTRSWWLGHCLSEVEAVHQLTSMWRCLFPCVLKTWPASTGNFANNWHWELHLKHWNTCLYVSLRGKMRSAGVEQQEEKKTGGTKECGRQRQNSAPNRGTQAQTRDGSRHLSEQVRGEDNDPSRRVTTALSAGSLSPTKDEVAPRPQV